MLHFRVPKTMNRSNEEILPDVEAVEDETAKVKEETEKESREVEKLPPDAGTKPKPKTGSDEDSVDGSSSDSDISDSEYICDVCDKKFSGFVPFKQHQKSKKHAKALLKKKREKKLQDKIKGGEEVVLEDEEHLFFIKKPVAVCKPCNKQFGDTEAYHLHLVSSAHKQKVIQSSILDKVREDGKINVDLLKELYKNKKTTDNADDLLEDAEGRIASLDDENADVFECEDCEKSFSGLIPYTQHLVSKTHAKTIEKKKRLEKLVASSTSEDQYSAESKLKGMSTLVIEDDILVCKLCSTSFSGPENAMGHLKSRNHSKKLDEYIRKLKRRQKSAAAEAKGCSSEDSDDESENKSDSEDTKDRTQDKELSVASEAAAPENKRSSADGNMGGEKENPDLKDKDNTLLAYNSYKNYKKVIEKAKEQD